MRSWSAPCASAAGSNIVVNNAGILVWEMIADIDETAYDELMAVNVKGAFALTHHACAHWRAAAERGGRVSARIINTVSGIGLFGFARGGVYGASKGAVLSLTNVTAMEMRRYGVTANAIWPEARAGTSKGIFPEAPEDPDAFDGYLPENISPLVVYLATEAAGWLTGQVIYIQGDRVRRMDGWSVAGEYQQCRRPRAVAGRVGCGAAALVRHPTDPPARDQPAGCPRGDRSRAGVGISGSSGGSKRDPAVG